MPGCCPAVSSWILTKPNLSGLVTLEKFPLFWNQTMHSWSKIWLYMNPETWYSSKVLQLPFTIQCFYAVAIRGTFARTWWGLSRSRHLFYCLQILFKEPGGHSYLGKIILKPNNAHMVPPVSSKIWLYKNPEMIGSVCSPSWYSRWGKQTIARLWSVSAHVLYAVLYM